MGSYCFFNVIFTFINHHPIAEEPCASAAPRDTHAEARLADAGGEVRRPGDLRPGKVISR